MTHVTERMFSPSIETIVSVSLQIISAFLGRREDAFDQFDIYQRHGCSPVSTGELLGRFGAPRNSMTRAEISVLPRTIERCKRAARRVASGKRGPTHFLTAEEDSY